MKAKDYYDKEYVSFLVNKINYVTKCFDSDLFMNKCLPSLETLEFNDRQFLLATSLKAAFLLNYEETINVFYEILGEEIEGSLGMFSDGWWLWPIGKYVELYGGEDFEISCSFSKELTKRFTSEFCMRTIIINYPEKALNQLLEWSSDDNKRVRRLSSECIRIRLPWAKKIYIALDYFNIYKQILTNLKDDTDKTIQKSVGNNLNDLYKEDKHRFSEIINEWQTGDISKECQWIIKHGSRTKNKELNKTI